MFERISQKPNANPPPYWWKKGGEKMYYKPCPECGANLDPGEICECLTFWQTEDLEEEKKTA